MKSATEKILKGISFLTHPIFTFPLVLLLPFLVWRYLLWQYFIVLAIAFIFPFLFFLYLYKKGRISNWDVTERKQRYGIFAAAFIGLLLATGYLGFYSIGFMFTEFLKLLFLATIFILINFKIKASLHTAFVTIACMLSIQFFALSPLILIAVPIVAYTRVALNKHKPLEVTLGAIIPLLFYFIF